VIDPNSVDWVELIRQCVPTGDVIAVPYKEGSGKIRYAVVVCPVEMAKDILRIAAGPEQEAMRLSADVLPIKGRN